MFRVRSSKLAQLRSDYVVRLLVLPAIESPAGVVIQNDGPTAETNRYAVMVEKKSGKRSYELVLHVKDDAEHIARSLARERKLVYLPWKW